MCDRFTLAPVASRQLHPQENGTSPGHSGVPGRTRTETSRIMSPAHRRTSPARPRAREELLIDRARKVLRAQRAAGAAGERAEHALHELHVLEAPQPELLLVFQERLGQEEQGRRPLAGVERLQLDLLRGQQVHEQILQRRPRERALHERGNLAVLLEHVHEVRLAQPRRRFDRAKLHALRATRAAEVLPELGEVLRWQRLERGELRGDDAHEGVDAAIRNSANSGSCAWNASISRSSSWRISLNHSSLA